MSDNLKEKDENLEELDEDLSSVFEGDDYIKGDNFFDIDAFENDNNMQEVAAGDDSDLDDFTGFAKGFPEWSLLPPTQI